MSKCSIQGCKKEVLSLGICSMHYTRVRRYSTTDKPLSKSELLLENGEAHCCTCKHTKPITEFCKDSQTSHGFSRRCKKCNSRKGKDNYKNNKHKHQDYARKKRFGLDRTDYETLISAQLNSCAICKTKFTKRAPAVDHDHVTGVVRGLLCSRCNLGLGIFKDDPQLLKKATTYLTENKNILA